MTGYYLLGHLFFPPVYTHLDRERDFCFAPLFFPFVPSLFLMIIRPKRMPGKTSIICPAHHCYPTFFFVHLFPLKGRGGLRGNQVIPDTHYRASLFGFNNNFDPHFLLFLKVFFFSPLLFPPVYVTQHPPQRCKRNNTKLDVQQNQRSQRIIFSLF